MLASGKAHRLDRHWRKLRELRRRVEGFAVDDIADRIDVCHTRLFVLRDDLTILRVQLHAGCFDAHLGGAYVTADRDEHRIELGGFGASIAELVVDKLAP